MTATLHESSVCHLTVHKWRGSSEMMPSSNMENKAMPRARIMVAEDERIIALELEARLQHLGYEVSAIVSSGEEAIKKAEQIRPDLALMDIRLRGRTDGVEAAETIRARFGIPIVYITAHTDEETLQRAMLTEPYGYLLKPFEEREIHSTLEIALYKHKSENALRESERRLRLYSERLSILHEIDQAILVADSPEAIARATLCRIRDLLPCRWASVVACNGEPDRVVFQASQTDSGTDMVVDERGLAERSVQEARSGRCKAQIVHDLLAVAQPSQKEQTLLAGGMRSYVSIPLLVQGVVVGSLDVGADKPEAFGQEQIAIAHEVANSLALAIHHASLRQNVERHAAELQMRNRELDAFAHTVAHGLKDPLGMIVGFAEVLAKDHTGMSTGELQKYLDIIEQHGRKMNNIIRELLLLSEVRLLDVPGELLDMGQIVADAEGRLAHMVDRYQAQIIKPETWPQAVGYGPWVEEVWVNYLSNAIKYGGTPPCVELGAEILGDDVRFWVRDNGSGIPPEIQSQLFAPFKRLDRARAEGHGLGLSIVRRIVEKLGGRVEAQSSGAQGEGCVFSFTLLAAATVVEQSL